MKRAKVSELQDRLSAYLADVRGGDTVIVCDRNTPIARLVPYDDDADGFVVNEPLRAARTLCALRSMAALSNLIGSSLTLRCPASESRYSLSAEACASVCR